MAKVLEGQSYRSNEGDQNDITFKSFFRSSLDRVQILGMINNRVKPYFDTFLLIFRFICCKSDFSKYQINLFDKGVKKLEKEIDINPKFFKKADMSISSAVERLLNGQQLKYNKRILCEIIGKEMTLQYNLYPRRNSVYQENNGGGRIIVTNNADLERSKSFIDKNALSVETMTKKTSSNRELISPPYYLQETTPRTQPIRKKTGALKRMSTHKFECTPVRQFDLNTNELSNIQEKFSDENDSRIKSQKKKSQIIVSNFSLLKTSNKKKKSNIIFNK
ncbi:UNKNOWN [Stylonychia lemnae]|uniref:Uncharacterized protein n=1 Tax=Stylonychia lemnae TaxID=5949 RepID=A0A078B6N9_STYLE|nr:UNKNOWN [Stylonychia lemnae]|eukprot:CDW88952.1 UNKNOWN [Stylonychia lemnae]